MAIFEFARWDGSQRFQHLSAEAAFDKLSEYLLEHGEYLLRQLERLGRAGLGPFSGREAPGFGIGFHQHGLLPGVSAHP